MVLIISRSLNVQYSRGLMDAFSTGVYSVLISHNVQFVESIEQMLLLLFLLCCLTSKFSFFRFYKRCLLFN